MSKQAFVRAFGTGARRARSLANSAGLQLVQYSTVTSIFHIVPSVTQIAVIDVLRTAPKRKMSIGNCLFYRYAGCN
jgi:hypothetical protein